VKERLPRPDHILVYDFVATPNDVPAQSALANHASVQRTPQTDEQIATGRRVSAEIATQLSARRPARRIAGLRFEHHACSGEVNLVQIDQDHLISPEERYRLAMARQ